MQNNPLLIAWLRDAHSMEEALEDFIKKAHKDFAEDNTAQQQLDNLALASSQAQTEIREQLEKLDEKPSGGKDFLGKIIGLVTGAGASMYKDDAVKDLLVLNGVFHFAHASYVSLAHAAQVSGDEFLANTCEQLAQTRKEAAKWVGEYIPGVTEHTVKNQSS